MDNPGRAASINQPRLIFRNTVALGSARVLERGSGALLSIFIARYLGASSLGVYSAAIVCLTLLSRAAEMGSTVFVTREIARDNRQTGAYVVHFGLITLIVSSCVITAALCLVPRLGFSVDLKASIFVVAFATIPAVIRTIQEAVFLAYQRAEFIIWSTAGGALLNVIVSLILLHRGHGIVTMVGVYAAVQYVNTLCYFTFINRYICRLQWRFNFRFAWTLVISVRAFAGSSVLGGLLSRPEVMILSFFGNDTQNGFYSAALRIVDLWGVIAETYMKNVFPVLSNAYVSDRSRYQLVASSSVTHLVAVSLPIMCGILAAARPIVRTLYGPAFETSVPVLRVMVLCIPFGFLFELFWRLLAACDQQHLMLRAQVIMAVLRLVAGYFVIAQWAAFGAGLCASVTLIVHMGLLIWYAGRNGTRPFAWSITWRLAIAAIVTGGTVAALMNHLHVLVVAVAAGVVYASMLVLLKAVSPDDLWLLRRTRQERTPA